MQNSDDTQANKAVWKHRHGISVCVRMRAGEQVSQRLRHLWILIICLRTEKMCLPRWNSPGQPPSADCHSPSVRSPRCLPGRLSPSLAHQACSHKVNVPYTDSFFTFSPYRLQSGEKLRTSSACPKCAPLKAGIANPKCLQCLSVSIGIRSNSSTLWLYFVSFYNIHL